MAAPVAVKGNLLSKVQYCWILSKRLDIPKVLSGGGRNSLTGGWCGRERAFLWSEVWDGIDETIGRLIKAAESGRMPVGRFFVLRKLNRKIDNSVPLGTQLQKSAKNKENYEL